MPEFMEAVLLTSGLVLMPLIVARILVSPLSPVMKSADRYRKRQQYVQKLRVMNELNEARFAARQEREMGEIAARMFREFQTVFLLWAAATILTQRERFE